MDANIIASTPKEVTGAHVDEDLTCHPMEDIA